MGAAHAIKTENAHYVLITISCFFIIIISLVYGNVLWRKHDYGAIHPFSEATGENDVLFEAFISLHILLSAQPLCCAQFYCTKLKTKLFTPV